MDRRADLAEFLRERRRSIDPRAYGLPAGPGRRTPGLRREEVAQLAGVSLSWYTWLEQGRPIKPSIDVLEALARTLLLDPVEREHLLALAGHPWRSPLSPGRDECPSSLITLLLTIEPHPAYVLGPRWDYLAWNRPHAALFPEIERLPVAERNLVWVVFANDAARSLIVDWEDEARRVLSQFRAEITPFRDDPSMVSLVERLRASSEEFAAWWPRHELAGAEGRLRRFDHPTIGELRFDHQQLVPAGEPDLRVVVHLPVEGDHSAERLAALWR